MQWLQQECLRSLLRVSDWESSLSVPGSTAIFWVPAASIRPAFRCCCVNPQVSLPDTDFQSFFILLIMQHLLFQKNSYSQRDHHAFWLHKWHILTCKYPSTIWHAASPDSSNELWHRIIQPQYNRTHRNSALYFHSPLFAGIPGSDYINANYIDGYRKQNAYIATQGALPETFGDFWRMMWEQQGATVVMMTKLEERSRVRKG